MKSGRTIAGTIAIHASFFTDEVETIS